MVLNAKERSSDKFKLSDYYLVSPGIKTLINRSVMVQSLTKSNHFEILIVQKYV